MLRINDSSVTANRDSGSRKDWRVDRQNFRPKCGRNAEKSEVHSWYNSYTGAV
jgi:hypothetical protein